MDETAAADEGTVPSPNASLTLMKEQAEDRLATRNSFQIGAEEERECKSNKRKNMKVKWLTHQPKPQLPLVITKDEASQTKPINLMSLTQNQRLTSSDQFKSIQDQPHKNHLNTKVKRNKIFSHSFKSRQYHFQDEHSQNFMNVPKFTKRISEKLDTTFRQDQRSSTQFFQLKKKKERWVLHEINDNPTHDFPTAAKEKCEANTLLMSNLILSYPKMTPVHKETQNYTTPADTNSLLFKPNQMTERIQIMQDDDTHINPVAKKIKSTKNKRVDKEQICSFSKLTLRKVQIGKNHFGNDSRASNCMLPECLIKDNLVNCNIGVLQSSQSEQQSGERYYDTEEESPIRQKVSYRNIDVQYPNSDSIDDDEGRHNNLFSDFQFPVTPKRNYSEKRLDVVVKEHRIAVHEKPPKTALQFYLIGLALLLLIIQMFG